MLVVTKFDTTPHLSTTKARAPFKLSVNVGSEVILPRPTWLITPLDYQFLRLGRAGYHAIMTNLTHTADFLAESILSIGDGNKFLLMSKKGGEGLPLVAWRLKNKEKYDGMPLRILAGYRTFY